MLSFTLAMAAFMVFTRSAGMRQEGQLVNAPVPCTVHAAWLLCFPWSTSGPQPCLHLCIRERHSELAVCSVLCASIILIDQQRGSKGYHLWCQQPTLYTHLWKQGTGQRPDWKLGQAGGGEQYNQQSSS